MHGIRPKALVDQVRPDDFRRNAGVDVILGKAPRGVFGCQKLADLPLRIGSAAATVCQPYRMTGPSVPASRPRQGGRWPD
jgi:hypothetical protein